MLKTKVGIITTDGNPPPPVRARDDLIKLIRISSNSPIALFYSLQSGLTSDRGQQMSLRLSPYESELHSFWGKSWYQNLHE